ncbi:MAG: hypothetical protein ABIL15_03915 [candidate division WOR-3 bacterium]
MSLLFLNLILALKFPLELHCYAHFGRYLTAALSRYYMDSSVSLSGTFIEYNNFLFFLNYQDDLEVKGGDGVLFDPRYVHYYIAGGFDYLFNPVFIRLCYIHDCFHNIDSLSTQKPIFNRFRFQIGSVDFHYSRSVKTFRRLLLSLYYTYYAHWQYHGWDINAGADYNYDFALQGRINFFNTGSFGGDFVPDFLIARGESLWYQQHLFKLLFYYKSNSCNRLGVGLIYNLFNNDPIRSPDRLWQFIVFFHS